MDRIPTLEEYKAGIWYFYYRLLDKTAPEEKLRAYFNGDEATEEIYMNYKSDVRACKEGTKFHTDTAMEGCRGIGSLLPFFDVRIATNKGAHIFKPAAIQE